MKFKETILILLLSALLGVLAQAQDKPQRPPKPTPKPADDTTIRIETELVQVEVTVTDKQGKVIRNLKREDFELKEDGKPQDISYFSVGTATRPARWLGTDRKERKDEASTTTTTSTTNPTEAVAGRYIVLAVDDLHIAAVNLLQARKALLKFVEQQMGSGDQVALITTSGQLNLFQQFTNDREALKRAINRLNVQERTVTTSFDVPRITPYQAELIDMGDRDALELAVQEILRLQPMGGGAGNTAQASGNAGGGRGGASNTNQAGGTSEYERAMEMARSRARMIVMQNAQYTVNTLTTLDAIIRSLRSLPGRKIMTLVTDGFFLNNRSASTTYDTRRVIDAATRAGVVIYAIDSRGLTVSSLFDASQPGFGNEQPPGVRERVENAAMDAVRNGPFALAHDTGGFMVFNTNDLNLGFQQVLEDSDVYYLLAFEPVESYRDGRFRRLEVRVREHPEYKIRSSKGYFAPDDKAIVKAAEKEEKERVELEKEKGQNPEKAAKKMTTAKTRQLWEALGSLFPLRNIPLEMSADFVDTGKGEGFALILAHLDISGLKFERRDNRYLSTVDLVGVVFDEKGKTVDSFSQKLNMHFSPKAYEHALLNGFVFNRRVKLKPGFYQVRVAAIKENPRQSGSAADWIEVSDLSTKRLVLSSVFLATEEETMRINAQAAENNQAEQKVEEQLITKPAQVARRFKQGSSVDFTIFAYNAKPDSKGNTDLVVQSQLFSGSKVIYASPLTRMADPSELAKSEFIPYAARLSLEQFEPGSYELRLLVIDRNTKTSAKRTINFVVEP